MALALAPHAPVCLLIQGLKERESDVDRLVIICPGARHVTRERARGASWRRFFQLKPLGQTRRVKARKPAHRDRFHVALDAADLAREEDLRMLAHLHRGSEHARRAYVCITMNLTVLQELRPLQSRDQA